MNDAARIDSSLPSPGAAQESRTHHLTLPLAREAIDEVRAGDMVYLTGHITCTIGLPTHERMVGMLDRHEPLPIDLRGGAFLHLSVFNRELPDSAGAYEALYMCTTTSTRYVSYMPRLIEGCGLRVVGGKGGLDRPSIEAMQRQGCIYLSFLGGGCPLLSEAIRGVVSVHWTDYISQFRLVTLDVASLGPATVGIDAHGTSLYETLHDDASQRLPEIMASLKAQREAPGA